MHRATFITLLLCALARAALAAPGDIENLGSFGGKFGSFEGSRGRDINDAGDVVGSSYTSATNTSQHAFLRPAGGAIQDLIPVGANAGLSVATSINNAGVITGLTDHLLEPPPGYERAFIRPAGGPVQTAGVTMGSFSNGGAINAAGDITGQIGFPSAGINNGTYIRRASGAIQQIAPLAGFTGIYATAINDSRDIAGALQLTSSTGQAFIRRDPTGVIEPIATLGGNTGQANGINSAGDVVGQSKNSAGQTRAFLRRASDGIVTELQPLSSATTSIAYGIDDNGIILGTSNGPGASHALAWNDEGDVFDLDAWLDSINPSAGAFWTLTEARAMNSSGLIIGTGAYNDGAGGLSDGTRAFVLDASTVFAPEPTSLSVIAFLLPFLRRRKM